MNPKNLYAIFWNVIVLLAVVLAGCKAEQLTPPAYAPQAGSINTPSSVSVTFTATGTTTPVITSIPNGGTADVHATIRDAAGSLISGVAIAFTVAGGAANGTLSSPSATTDASGVATTTLTAVAADQQITVTAVATLASGGTIMNTASITAGTIVNPPSQVAVSFAATGTTTPAITNIGNGGTADVLAAVRDASNNPLAGVTVNFSVGGGAATGTLSAASATTDASGIATVTYTAVAADTLATITASITAGAATINNSAALEVGTAPPPIPSTMTLTISPLTVDISGQVTVTAAARDANGNAAYDTRIMLEISTNPALGSFSSTDPLYDVTPYLTAGAAGTVMATFYAGSSSGLVTIRATAIEPLGVLPAITPITKTQTLSITSSPASIDLQAANSNLTVSGSTQLIADVRNIMNNPATNGTTVNFALTAGATNVGTLSSATATTVDGRAQVIFDADPNNTGTVVVTATTGTAPDEVSSSTLISVSQADTGSITFTSATPTTITVQGASPTSSSIKFIVKNTFGNPQPNVNVSFTLFGPTGATINPASAVSDASGVVTTTLVSGNVSGPARIVASDPIAGLSTSGTVAIGGGVPSYDHFGIAASRVNLEGLNCYGVETTFTAYVADRDGNFNVPKDTLISFTTEAGSINTSGLTDATGETTVILKTQPPLPADVAPSLTGWPNSTGVEPSYTYNGHTYNPRDGWLTVRMSVIGEESFADTNANGVYDYLPAPEALTDLPEPFLDTDDSRAWATGEQFFDWPPTVTPEAGNPANPNYIYDDPNGVWDAQIPIFKFYTLVFSGAPHIGDISTGVLTSYMECVEINGVPCPGPESDMTLNLGETAKFRVYVSDINMNKLKPGSSVSVMSSPKGSPSVVEGNPHTISDGLSFGPTVLTVSLTNNLNPANDIPTDIDLKAEINWPGGCVSPALKTGVSYKGRINWTLF